MDSPRAGQVRHRMVPGRGLDTSAFPRFQVPWLESVPIAVSNNIDEEELTRLAGEVGRGEGAEGPGGGQRRGEGAEGAPGPGGRHCGFCRSCRREAKGSCGLGVLGYWWFGSEGTAPVD